MTERDVDDVLRAHAPHVVGALTRRFGHFEEAEDAAQEALLAASRQWRADGIPDQPRAWLIRVGYRRMVDVIRSEVASRRREEEYAVTDPALVTGGGRAATALDDSLHLLVLCCHPTLSPASRIALTLRAVGGLTTSEIARAYGVTEATMAVRISRAKQQLRTAGARFELAAGEELPPRVASVLRVLYLIFNEGYTASAGDRLLRTDLSAEAVRLARLLHAQLPSQPEVGALLALMLLTDARRATRVDDGGALVPLAEQDRTRWDRERLEEGGALLSSVWDPTAVGPYQLQAAVAALHADAASPEQTDWPQIADLYAALDRLEPGGPAALSRVVAVAHAQGAAAALALLDTLDREHGLLSRPLTAQRALAVRAHLLDDDGHASAARADYLAAAGLAANDVEAAYLQGRAQAAGAEDAVDDHR